MSRSFAGRERFAEEARGARFFDALPHERKLDIADNRESFSWLDLDTARPSAEFRRGFWRAFQLWEESS